MYDDIIGLPHHTSIKHPSMPMSDRAAQFSPFAALAGYDAAINETARLTDKKVELSEDAREALDRTMQLIMASQQFLPTVSITYFVPDSLKDGGSYRTLTGQIKRLDDVARIIIMCDGNVIPLDDVYAILSNDIQDDC